MLIARTLAACFLVAAPTCAFAQGTFEQRLYCMSDGFKFCAKHIPDIPAITKCMEDNFDSLTPQCQGQFGPEFAEKRKRK